MCYLENDPFQQAFHKDAFCLLFFFTLYTNDYTRTENTILIKYSDDTVIVDLSNSIPQYMAEVVRFTTWYKDDFLDLNVTKTEELLIDLREQPPAVSPITID